MLRNGLEPWHVALVAVVVLLLFGSKKLPDAARGIGRSLRIFKSEVAAMKATEPAAAASAAGSAGAAEPPASGSAADAVRSDGDPGTPAPAEAGAATGVAERKSTAPPRAVTSVAGTHNDH